MTYKQSSTGNSTSYGNSKGKSSYGSTHSSSASYTMQGYNRSAMKAGYKLAAPPAGKPYDLRNAMKSLDGIYGSSNSAGNNPDRYSLARPQLTYAKPSLRYSRQGLYLEVPELELRMHSEYPREELGLKATCPL